MDIVTRNRAAQIRATGVDDTVANRMSGDCKCVMHLLSHHAPTGAWYFGDIIGSNIIVMAYTSGMRPYRCIPR